MNGKLVAGFIVVIALLGGVAMYWLQEYAYYEKVSFKPGDEIELTPLSGPPEAIPVANLQGIDATSSPLRFRACFTTTLDQATLTDGYKVYQGAVPLVGPSWFSCFDAGKLTADLASGVAIAFLSQADVAPQIDSVVAVYPDGHAYAWHQVKPGIDVNTGAEE